MRAAVRTLKKCDGLILRFRHVEQPGLAVAGLIHNPKVYREAEKIGCDFCLAGHTHGGQIRLPFFGTTIAACSMEEQYTHGRGRLGSMVTLTSNGIGGFWPFRIKCPPEILEITLRAS